MSKSMNKELIVILAGMLETDYGLCRSITRGSYYYCKGVLCSNCVCSFLKRKPSNHYVYLIASIPLQGFALGFATSIRKINPTKDISMNTKFVLATDVPAYQLTYNKEQSLWKMFIGNQVVYIKATKIGKSKYYLLNGRYYKRLRDSLFSVLYQEMQPFQGGA